MNIKMYPFQYSLGMFSLYAGSDYILVKLDN